jgi:hypothetical protein
MKAVLKEAAMSHPAVSPRSARRLLLACAGLGLLGLGGCAGSATPVAQASVLVQQAYAQNATIHAVSDALDRRLDAMLAVQTAAR